MSVNATVKVDSNGRLVVPSALRRELGFEPGVTLVVELHGRELRVRRLREAVAEAQASLRAYVPAGSTSPVEDLLASRRLDAKRERKQTDVGSGQGSE